MESQLSRKLTVWAAPGSWKGELSVKRCRGKTILNLPMKRTRQVFLSCFTDKKCGIRYTSDSKVLLTILGPPVYPASSVTEWNVTISVLKSPLGKAEVHQPSALLQLGFP